MVTIRRCELYTILSLLLVILVSAFNGSVNLIAETSGTIYLFRENDLEASQKPLQTMIILMYALTAGMLLYAGLHTMFAL